MFVLSNFVSALAEIFNSLLSIYSWVVLIAVLVSWVRPDPYHPIVQVLRSATEPVFDWVRRHIPFAVLGAVDLSPLLVFFLIRFMQTFLVRSLQELSYYLR